MKNPKGTTSITQQRIIVQKPRECIKQNHKKKDSMNSKDILKKRKKEKSNREHIGQNRKQISTVK